MNIQQAIAPIIRSPYFWQILQGLQLTGSETIQKQKITTDVVEFSSESLRLSREGVAPIKPISSSGTSTDGCLYDEKGKKQSARK